MRLLLQLANFFFAGESAGWLRSKIYQCLILKIKLKNDLSQVSTFLSTIFYISILQVKHFLFCRLPSLLVPQIGRLLVDHGVLEICCTFFVKLKTFRDDLNKVRNDLFFTLLIPVITMIIYWFHGILYFIYDRNQLHHYKVQKKKADFSNFKYLIKV